jgi:hypothetical protein
MTTPRSDPSSDFAWDEQIRTRVEQRAREIRGRRTSRNLLGIVVAVVSVGVFLTTVAHSGSSGVQVVATAPDQAAELAPLLPPPASLTAIVPELHIKALAGNRDYGVLGPTELVGAHGATTGVTRQWVGAAGSVTLRPGQQYPDAVSTVISSVVMFDTPEDARAWTGQTAASTVSPVALPAASTTPDGLVVLRGAGYLAAGDVQYLAVFTDGRTAFALTMVAGASGSHDGDFVRLVEAWTKQPNLPQHPVTTQTASPTAGSRP